MASQLTRDGHRLMAIALLLGLQTHLKSGKLVGHRKSDLIKVKKEVLGSWSLVVCHEKKPLGKCEQLDGQCTHGWRMTGLAVSDVATADMRCEGRQNVDLLAPGIQNATLKSCRHLGNQKHSGALGSERQHQQAVQDSGRNIIEKKGEGKSSNNTRNWIWRTRHSGTCKPCIS